MHVVYGLHSISASLGDQNVYIGTPLTELNARIEEIPPQLPMPEISLQSLLG